MIYTKKLYHNDYQDKLNRYNENMNVYKSINNEKFYELWDCRDTYDKWKMCYKLLNDNIKFMEGEYVEDTIQEKQNEILVKKSLKYNINIGYIKSLLETLEITDIRKCYKYNNKEFMKLLGDKLEKLIELDNEYSSNLTELNNLTIMKNDFRKDFNDMNVNNKKEKEKIIWKKYKNIIIYLNDWFSKINIRIKFLDKNVNSNSGKLKISFNDNHKFNSDLDCEKIYKLLTEYECEDIVEVKKIKKGFKDNNNKSVYKTNTSHYKETGIKDISFDIRNNELVLELDIDYEKVEDNEVFRRYKHKNNKVLCKKKDNDTTKLISDNYDSVNNIEWCKYDNMVYQYTNERLDNLEKISMYENPLKQEIVKKFNEINSPVMTKIEIVKLEECMIED